MHLKSVLGIIEALHSTILINPYINTVSISFSLDFPLLEIFWAATSLRPETKQI